MNIQIYGTKKCFDTKKAQRYFKERGIKFQFTDLNEKGMSKGELRNVRQAAGGLDAILNEHCKDQDALALVRYIADFKNPDCQKRKTCHSRISAGCMEALGINERLICGCFLFL